MRPPHVHRFLVATGIALNLISMRAYGQNDPDTRIYYHNGTYEDGAKRCADHFYPRTEVRALSDIPLTLLITEINDETTVGPAAGLDVLGFWLNAIRPSCRDGGRTEYSASTQSEVAVPDSRVSYRRFTENRTGTNVAIFATANAAYTIFAVDRELRILDPNNPTDPSKATTEQLSEAKAGAYLSGGIGLLADWRWITRGTKGNRIALGVFARYGWFTGTEEAIVSYGPILNLSIF